MTVFHCPCFLILFEPKSTNWGSLAQGGSGGHWVSRTLACLVQLTNLWGWFSKNQYQDCAQHTDEEAARWRKSAVEGQVGSWCENHIWTKCVETQRLQSYAALCLVFKAVGKMKTRLSHWSQSRFIPIALEYLLNPPFGVWGDGLAVKNTYYFLPWVSSKDPHWCNSSSRKATILFWSLQLLCASSVHQLMQPHTCLWKWMDEWILNPSFTFTINCSRLDIKLYGLQASGFYQWVTYILPSRILPSSKGDKTTNRLL